ncbi:hypothetical protein O9993_10345 [Vibrio lentus]|nr:hypothetical protein [Vibrio lentus]
MPTLLYSVDCRRLSVENCWTCAYIVKSKPARQVDAASNAAARRLPMAKMQGVPQRSKYLP